MSFKDPEAVTAAGAEKGTEKARPPGDKALLAGFLAGACIAFGAPAGDLREQRHARLHPGHAAAFFAGAVFSLGRILAVIAGSELPTGNMAIVPLAALRRRVGAARAVARFPLGPARQHVLPAGGDLRRRRRPHVVRRALKRGGVRGPRARSTVLYVPLAVLPDESLVTPRATTWSIR